MAITITWRNLLNLTDLEFVPGPPQTFRLSDEIQQTIAWLTGATTHDRRLLRCDEFGALLVNNGWSNLNAFEGFEMHPDTGASDTVFPNSGNKGVLVTTSTQIIVIRFYRVSGVIADKIYIPANTMYWYPHKTFGVGAATVPDPGGTASYVGVTVFK